MSTKDEFQLWMRSVNPFSDSCTSRHRDQILLPRLNSDIGRHCVGLRCTAYPEGYEDHKTLDGPAKILIGIFVAAIVLTILAVVGVIFFVASGR